MNRDLDSEPLASGNCSTGERAEVNFGSVPDVAENDMKPQAAGLKTAPVADSGFATGYPSRPAAAYAQATDDRSGGEAYPSQHPPAQRQQKSHLTLERETFLIFIKILFKMLQDAGELETRSKAQRIVMECKRRSQQGDPNFTPMMEALQKRLRSFLGEAKWRRAHLFLTHFLENRQRQQMSHSMMPASRPPAVMAGAPL